MTDAEPAPAADLSLPPELSSLPLPAEVVSAHGRLAGWRRDLHAHPETAFEEHRTAAMVARRLRAFGCDVTEGVGRTGVVGTLRRGRGAGSLGLRADMDALPTQERTGLPWASTIDGKFHGCGHDGHTAMLLGAAEYLAARGRFEGTVHFIFQPAEERDGGGRYMVEDGLFERFPCDRVYAFHNWPELPLGAIACGPGPVMAASDSLDVVVGGKGGHAAFPHLCQDPVPVAAQLITAMQQLVSRETAPQDQAVLSVTQLRAGSARNVIPDEVTFSGTLRTTRPETRRRLLARLEELATSLPAAFGGRGELETRAGYPATINEPEAAAFAAGVARSLVGDAGVVERLPPSMGCEDFAYMLQACPGAYLWLGQRGANGQGGAATACDVDHAAGLHSSRYDFNDALLPLGATLHVRLVEAALPAD